MPSVQQGFLPNQQHRGLRITAPYTDSKHKCPHYAPVQLRVTQVHALKKAEEYISTRIATRAKNGKTNAPPPRPCAFFLTMTQPLERRNADIENKCSNRALQRKKHQRTENKYNDEKQQQSLRNIRHCRSKSKHETFIGQGFTCKYVVRVSVPQL